MRAEYSGAYRPAATENGWTLDFMHGAGNSASAHSNSFRSCVSSLPPSEAFLGHGNPHFVQREQRNRVMRIGELTHLNQHQPYDTLYRALGIQGHDQLRVLICDGPLQMSWVGATREEPFTEREVALLRPLIKPLQRRFRLERHLGGPEMLVAMFETTLEALGTAAFVIGPRPCAEVTVENHITELFRRCGAKSRAGLVGRLLTLP